MGNHADVVVSGDKAYIVYFVHPGRTKTPTTNGVRPDQKRSVIQIAELTYENGVITCDRDKPLYIKLKH